MTRDAYLAYPPARALLKLCGDFPPVSKDRPECVRWILFDAGYYSRYSRAYRDGVSGDVGPEPTTLAYAAWLAGCDASQSQPVFGATRDAEPSAASDA